MTSVFKHNDFKKEAEYLQAKREKAIAYLGEKWLLHPVNHAKPKQKAPTSKG